MALSQPLSHRGAHPWLEGMGRAPHPPVLGLIPNLGREDVTHAGVPPPGNMAPPQASPAPDQKGMSLADTTVLTAGGLPCRVGWLSTLHKVAQSQDEAPPKERLEGLSGKQYKVNS